MGKPQVVMALYKPKAGKTKELEELVKKHFPTLKEYGLTTDHPPFIGKSQDGTFVEVFEWISEQAAKKAHDHPGVAKIWEAMGLVAEWGTLDKLPEGKKPFSHFERAF